MKAQVDRLRDQQAVAADYSERVQRLEEELSEQHKLLGFGQMPGRTPIPAEITGIFAFDNRLTLDVGSSEGVKPGMPVVSGRGLLAIVQTVDVTRCQALLLSSPVTQIGAIAQRTPPPAGLLRGEGGNTLVVEFMDQASAVQNGDEVVTSGFSSWIPRGIPIGRIIRIEDDPYFGTKRAYVYPYATVGAAREVYVLK